ncbi:hypothetical protein GGF41_001137 [Coemansia sp. RSA 2531]|nr:hypothetical protein GGF41_001137 [Coemansia sp. RSA 2531]
MGGPIDTNTETNKFLNNLVCTAKRLTALETGIAMAYITAAQHGQGFQNIKVFEVCRYGLSVYDTLGLLKVLPALVELRCSTVRLGSELENISSEELPDRIASTYNNVGRNLQVWRLNSHRCQYAPATIDYILLLALVCPNIWRIQLRLDTIQNYHTKLASALNSQRFSKYAPQLNRVLDIVRKYSSVE